MQETSWLGESGLGMYIQGLALSMMNSEIEEGSLRFLGVNISARISKYECSRIEEFSEIDRYRLIRA
jgi:hypothetical protein